MKTLISTHPFSTCPQVWPDWFARYMKQYATAEVAEMEKKKTPTNLEAKPMMELSFQEFNYHNLGKNIRIRKAEEGRKIALRSRTNKKRQHRKNKNRIAKKSRRVNRR